MGSGPIFLGGGRSTIAVICSDNLFGPVLAEPRNSEAMRSLMWNRAYKDIFLDKVAQVVPRAHYYCTNRRNSTHMGVNCGLMGACKLLQELVVTRPQQCTLVFELSFFMIILPREPWYAHRHFHSVKAKAEAEQTKVLWSVPWSLETSLKYPAEQRELWSHR